MPSLGKNNSGEQADGTSEITRACGIPKGKVYEEHNGEDAEYDVYGERECRTLPFLAVLISDCAVLFSM